MTRFYLKSLLLFSCLSFGVIGNVVACSCGPFDIPSPCELVKQVEASQEEDFIAIVELTFVEELDFSRTYSIVVVKNLAGAIPVGTRLESFDGSLCGQNLAKANYSGLLVGKLNRDGTVAPSTCQPEESFFPIENGEVVIKEHNGNPERRYPVGSASEEDCLFFDEIQPLFRIQGANPIAGTLDVRANHAYSSATTLSIMNAVGVTIEAALPLAPYDTRALASGLYFAVVRNEESLQTLPFVVSR